MNNKILAVALISLLAGCQSLHDKSEVRVSPRTLNKIDPPTPPVATAPAPTISPKTSHFLPGTDKIYFVGDFKVARRETDPQPVLMTESARRLIVGDPAVGDISIQPALLDKELAEELARSREINARNREMMQQMMNATSQLVNQTHELAERNKQLAEKLEQQIAYSSTLETKLTDSDKNKK